MSNRLLEKYRSMIRKEAIRLEKEGRYSDTKKYIQHSNISVYDHCFGVALLSVIIAEKLGITVNLRSLIVGALLHDYFLYDWHEKERKGHNIHGFTHPTTALKNAEEDWELNDIEKIIIKRHMFPLTFIPPTNREAWIVCIADKICATREVLSGRTFA